MRDRYRQGAREIHQKRDGERTRGVNREARHTKNEAESIREREREREEI